MRKSESTRILELTSGGLTVFQYYLGERCLSKMFCNPLRKDRHPSCRLYENRDSTGGSRYYMKDFANDDYFGDCFWFVARLTNKSLSTDFRSILETIDRDMGLGVFSDTPNASSEAVRNARRAQRTFEEASSSSIAAFDVRVKPFGDAELGYWAQYGITEETLRRYHVLSVEECNFRKASGKSFSVFGSDVMPVFGYSFSNGEGFKFYRPKSKSRFLYAGKLPHPYVFGWEQLPDSGETVYVTGGEKDVMALHSHGFDAVAFNSETARIDRGKMKELASRFEKVVFLYDSDETGIHESRKRCAEFGTEFSVYRIQLPLSGSKKEKDISDYFKKGFTQADFCCLPLETD